MIFTKKRDIAIFVHQKSVVLIFHTDFFYYKITFVNPQHGNTNSNGDFVLKPVKTFVLKISGIQK